MRIVSVRNLFGAIGRTVSIVFLCLGLFNSSTMILLAAVCVLWLSVLFSNLERKKFTVLAFLLTFFTFLLGTLVIRFFDPSVALRVTKKDTFIHMYICLYIALGALDIAILLSEYVHFTIRASARTRLVDNGRAFDLSNRVQRASRIVFLLTAVFPIAIAVEKVFFVVGGGSYLAYYVKYATALPTFFSKIAEINTFAFFFFLATMPDPRKSKLPIFIYLLIGILGMMYGQRNQFVMAVLFLTIYIIMYENSMGQEYLILKKRYIVIAMVAVPFVLVLLEYVQFIRDSRVFEFKGIVKTIKALFASLGGSVNVIGHGYELKEYFPQGHFYSLGGVIDFITKNALVRPFLGTTIYQGNTIEMALYGNSYGQTLSYLGWGAKTYLAGSGMGSCFIAEAFHDLGYMGVAAVSFIYGIILSKVNHLVVGNWLKNTIALISLYYVLYAPRDSAGQFIAAFFNFSFIVTALLIFVLSKCLKNNNQ